MNIDISTLYLVGVAQAVMLAAALILKRENQPANRLLSVILFFAAMDLFELYAFEKGLIVAWPQFPWMHIPYHFLYGPVIYLYASLMISRIGALRRRHLLHLSPFLAVLVLDLLLYYAIPDGARPSLLESGGGAGRLQGPLALRLAGGVYEVAYLSVTLLVLHRFSAGLKDYFSSIERMGLLWLRLLVTVMLLLMAVIYLHVPGAVSHTAAPGTAHAVTSLMGALFLLLVTFGALIQPELFMKIRRSGYAEEEGAEAGNDAPRYEKHRFGEAPELKLLRSLRDHMERDRPFLDENLTLKDLADALETAPHRISMVLNIHCGQNFYLFVNSYRVAEVLRMMRDPLYRESSILTMAFRAGFNSKSTFNAMFKKITGRTPSAHRATNSGK